MEYSYTIYFISIIILLILFVLHKINNSQYVGSDIYNLMDLIIDIALLLIISVPIVNTLIAIALTIIIVASLCLNFFRPCFWYNSLEKEMKTLDLLNKELNELHHKLRYTNNNDELPLLEKKIKYIEDLIKKRSNSLEINSIHSTDNNIKL